MARPDMRLLLWCLSVALFCFAVLPSAAAAASTTNSDRADQKNNVHAVIVSSSRYWFNYRHAMNALGIYDILKKNGVPDSHIILMLADEYATNPRNSYKNGMYANGVKGATWYSNSTEIDFRGADVNVQNFLDSVLGISPVSLDTDEESNLLIYLTGHGGDQFFKFQDEEELTAQDIANLAQELYDRKKFRRSLWIADTCQAFTLFDKLETPETLALGTSLREQNAYANHMDNDLGLSVIERWTNAFVNQQYQKANERTTLSKAMVEPFANKVLGADVGIREDYSSRKFKDILLSEFFGSKSTTVVNSNPSNKKIQDVIEQDISASTTISPPPRIPQKSENYQAEKLTKKSTENSRINKPEIEPNEPKVLPFVVLLVLAVFLFRSLEKIA